MKRFQILSLIGGGIRGAFITAFLDRLEQKLGKPLAESFDLIAGTSTGGIIAAGLAMGRSAAQMHDFYVRYGAKIFTPRPKYHARGAMRAVYPVVEKVVRWRTGKSLDSAFRARFCPHALEEAFIEGFGDRTMKDVLKTRLIVPSFNLTQGTPYSFRSRHLPKGVHDQDLMIRDVVIASTAAPTYFPHKVIGGQSYIDGGVWAADPSILAFAESIRVQQYESHRNEGDAVSVQSNDIHLLSIGTGRAQYSLSPPGADAGLLYWASHIADVMSTSQVQGIHLPLKFLLGDRYHHVNFEMKEKWALDDVSHIPELFRMGEQRAEATFQSLAEDFLQHQRKSFVPCQTNEEEINDQEFKFG